MCSLSDGLSNVIARHLIEKMEAAKEREGVEGNREGKQRKKGGWRDKRERD